MQPSTVKNIIMKKIDRVGQTFGRLKVLYHTNLETKGVKKEVMCICDCGNYLVVEECSLVSGATRSCGCLKKEVMEARGDGRTKEPLYINVYKNMIRRCYDSNHKNYHRYGGRGISICSQWNDNYQEFKNWAHSNGYKIGLQIDRINNDGNYEPDNCRFVTQKVNCNNQERTIILTYNGETKPLTAWAADLKISKGTIWSRMQKPWLTIDQILSKNKLPR